MVHLLGSRRTRYYIIVSVVLALWLLLLLLLFGNELGELQGALLKPLLEVSVPQHPETYNDSTFPIFPSLGETKFSAEPDLCSNFPLEWLEKVQVVLKTGVGQGDKNEAHLTSVTSCIRNIIVFSDVPERRHDREFIDIIEGLPESYLQHPDFSVYHKQRTAYDSGEPIGLSNEGWKLDRFKFLPMINEAYNMRPNASWYVFLEADVYMFWDNLFRFLNQINEQEMHYFGSATAGSHGRWFAYGGAGIIVSQGLMKSLVGDGTVLSEKYQEWMLADCCGDAVLGYVILDKTGVKVEDLYPMLSGDSLEALGVSEQRWCNPVLSLHRMTTDSLRSLWYWERTRRAQKGPLVYSTLLEYRQPRLQSTPSRDSWDNLSADFLGNANHSLSTCAQACETNQTCLQYSYTNSQCRIWPYVVLGHEVGDKDMQFTSGWNLDRISQLYSNSSNCEVSRWTRPVNHRCGFINCA